MADSRKRFASTKQAMDLDKGMQEGPQMIKSIDNVFDGEGNVQPQEPAFQYPSNYDAANRKKILGIGDYNAPTPDMQRAQQMKQLQDQLEDARISSEANAQFGNAPDPDAEKDRQRKLDMLQRLRDSQNSTRTIGNGSDGQ